MVSHEFLQSSREVKSLLSSDGGHGGKEINTLHIHHVPWKMCKNMPINSCSVFTNEVLNKESGDSINTEDNISSDNDKSNDSSTHPEQTEQTDVNIMTINKLTLHPTINNVMIDVDDYKYEKTGEITGVVLDDDDNEDNDEEFIAVHTFEEMDNKSMKILSFPDMKEQFKNNLCCKICYNQRHKGDIHLYQKTYKLATVLTIVCKYGHEFHIHPEKLMKTSWTLQTISR